MKRKDFLQLSGLSWLGLSLPSSVLLSSCTETEEEGHSLYFKELSENLLKDWCDGMMNVQILNPKDPKIHGILKCPVCDVIHGRCMDAVYPFFHMAKKTNDKKYLEAGIAVFEWAENVTLSDGSWTNTLNPKSWNGTTVFGAIALAETLHYHSDLLDAERLTKWTKRLAEAVDFVYKKFTISFTNINYGVTAIYCLNLAGRVLGNETYISRSRELAKEAKTYFTQPNHLLYGEVKPTIDKLSKKGLKGVDLGYNVEESLNNLVLYALHEKDEELISLLTKSLNSHLAFMLPDGGWDNSWGTRQFKWSYWGSRTTDGCQPAFGMMAHKNPAFGTAAIRSTELLKRCTHDGLLHGGIHYDSHNIKPCVHHTFSHAKNLAAILDKWEHLPEINDKMPLPRAIAQGINHYPEIDTTLFAKGEWRGTVTAYDSIYKEGNYRQATGGSLSVLYHNKVGLLCAASMAIYKLVEVNNQQVQPGEEFAFTPRVETFQNGDWYSNIFDREASISSPKDAEGLLIDASAKLKNEENEVLKDSANSFMLSYECSKENVTIRAKADQKITSETAFVLPIISPSGEEVIQNNTNEISIRKPEGLLSISCNVPLTIKESAKDRIFNMVPGAEAVPIIAFFKEDQNVEIKLSVK